MAAEETQKLGERVRFLRHDKRMTMAEVAEKSGLSKSTISKVENGQISLRYDNLHQLAKGLGVHISDLFSDEDARASDFVPQAVVGRQTVARAADATYIKAGWYEYWYLCSKFSHKSMIPILGRSSARSLDEFGPLVSHPGEEFAIVLEGEMDVYSEFYEPVRLKEGDHMYFDSQMGHAYITVSDEPCRFLIVCTDVGQL